MRALAVSYQVVNVDDVASLLFVLGVVSIDLNKFPIDLLVLSVYRLLVHILTLLTLTHLKNVLGMHLRKKIMRGREAMLDHEIFLTVCTLHGLSRIVEVVILEGVLVEDGFRNALALVGERFKFPLRG